MKIPKLEIACFNYESALIAEQGGADRIELCDSFNEGGTTPSSQVVELARKSVGIDLFIMIRPRGGNFCYSHSEFDQMKKSIIEFSEKGVNGFVFGILNADHTINIEQNKELIDLAKPLPCSFHRAFDKTPNSTVALDDLIKLGFKTILTSGHASSALEGLESLVELMKISNQRIVIMPGGGVRASNLTELHKKVNASFYHSSAITDKSNIANLSEIKFLKEKLI